MMNRCYRKATYAYERYGGAGVVVHERWHDFEKFLEDVGERPEGTTIDRFPNARGNYEPGNVRWATREQQNRHRPGYNVMLTVDGITRTLPDWADHLGVSQTALRRALDKGRNRRGKK
jgi:hypothetical protein